MFWNRKTVLIVLVLVVLTGASFAGGCVLGTGVRTASGGLETINEAWGIIFQDYVDKSKLDANALSQAAIKAMIEELNDPHTVYLDPQVLKLSQSDLSGKFEGIGAQVAVKEGKLILAPLPNTPAEKAGIRADDVVLEVNGKSIEGLNTAEVILLIRGPKGSTVSLLVQHEGESQPVKVDIVRDEINVSSVAFRIENNTAYVRLSHFSERTADDLAAVVQQIAQSPTQDIVLDLRGNPGGILSVVVEVAGYFLRQGVVVEMVDSQGKRTPTSVTPAQTVLDLPMVVLVDKYSASGSEVLAGALQDYKRATIIGTQTLGKGSVNWLRTLSDGSGIYITIARWLTPNGRLIEGVGLEPDITTELTGNEELRWAMDYLRARR